MGTPPPLSHPLQSASVSSIRPEALLQFRHFPLRATRSQRNPGPLLGNPESPMETAFRTLPRRKGVATFGLCDEALPSQNRPRVLNPGPSLLLPARPQLCRGGGRENPKAKSHPHPAPDPQSDSQQATSPLCASASTCGNPRIGPVGLSEDFANLLVQEDLCGKWRVPPELPTSLLPEIGISSCQMCPCSPCLTSPLALPTAMLEVGDPPAWVGSNLREWGATATNVELPSASQEHRIESSRPSSVTHWLCDLGEAP